jgi:hypothetical protein
LGLLGRLLHVSKIEEKRLPIIALILLCFSTVPWLYRKGKSLFKPATQTLLLIVLLVALPQFLRADAATEIEGILNASRYNAILGTPFSNTTVKVGFVTIISNDKWKICVTNLENKAWWGQISCDGTNIYTLNPEGDLWLDEQPSTDRIFSTVSPAPLYVAPVDDTLGLATLYVTYALSPKQMTPGEHGVLQMSLPWVLGRSSPRANGFRWIIATHTNAPFTDSFLIVRDKSTDLEGNKELLRPEVDFPHEVGVRDAYLQSLDYRKSIPNGYTQAVFACTASYSTNNKYIPRNSELKYYLYGGTAKHPYKFPIYQAYLRATNLTFLDGFEFSPNPPDVPARVHDYRFKKLANSRLFDYADYTLKAGETWRSPDDKVLLQQREYYLKHGPRIFAFMTRKVILVWLLFALIAAPVIIMLIFRQRQTTKTNETKN